MRVGHKLYAGGGGSGGGFWILDFLIFTCSEHHAMIGLEPCCFQARSACLRPLGRCMRVLAFSDVAAAIAAATAQHMHHAWLGLRLPTISIRFPTRHAPESTSHPDRSFSSSLCALSAAWLPPLLLLLASAASSAVSRCTSSRCFCLLGTPWYRC